VLNTCYKNDLTHLTENDFKRLIYSYSVKKPFNTIHCKWWNSYIGILHTPYLLWKWVQN